MSLYYDNQILQLFVILNNKTIIVEMYKLRGGYYLHN